MQRENLLPYADTAHALFLEYGRAPLPPLHINITYVIHLLSKDSFLDDYTMQHNARCWRTRSAH